MKKSLFTLVAILATVSFAQAAGYTATSPAETTDKTATATDTATTPVTGTDEILIEETQEPVKQ